MRASWSGFVGPSGWVKVDAAAHAGLLERPEAGKVMLDGIDCLSWMTRVGTSDPPGPRIGFVYQSITCFLNFNAADNIAMPLMICRGVKKEEGGARRKPTLAG